MILTGQQIFEQKLVTGLKDADGQIQPCGIDFTLKKIAIWTSAGCLDFDNSKRLLSETKTINFDKAGKVILKKGGYLVEFNEVVTLPNNVMATVQTRSSLFRCGAAFVAGVIDPGYHGVIGGLLQVWNEQGIILYKDAKLVQWVFAKLDQNSDKEYQGRYLNATAII